MNKVKWFFWRYFKHKHTYTSKFHASWVPEAKADGYDWVYYVSSHTCSHPDCKHKWTYVDSLPVEYLAKTYGYTGKIYS